MALSLVAAILGGHALALRSAVLTARDMVTGEGSLDRLRPGPRYQILRVPSTMSTARYDAGHHIASDFAQIYFPAREFAADTAYSDQTPDPWGRPSRYAPFVHWACAVTICTLPYGPASLAHMALQYAVFVVSFAYAFHSLGLSRYLPLGLLGINVGLFLTPVGLSLFERGQFSLYVAASYVWLLLGVYRTSAPFLAIAALLAYMKWTSFPMLFVVVGVWLLASPGRTALMHRTRAAMAAAATVAGLFLLFPQQSLEFLVAALDQENAFEPQGLSLARVVPRVLVKAMPLALVALGSIRMRRSRAGIEHMLPFMLGAAILLLLYPTWAYDYSVPCLFGLVPFALDWVSAKARDRGAWIVPGVFFLFLIAASAVKLLDVVAAADTDVAMIWAYLLCATALLAVPITSSQLEAQTP